MKDFVTWEPREEPLPKESLDTAPRDESLPLIKPAPRAATTEQLVPEAATPDDITIDPEFSRMIHDLSPAEFRQLSENIRMDGCLEPLSVWENDGKLILLDGHHRYKICQEQNRTFLITKIPLADREQARLWIIKKQLGRRSPCAFARIELLQPEDEIVRREATEKKQTGYQKRGSDAEASDTQRIHTDDIMARKAEVSSRTYAKAREIIRRGSEELKEQLRKEELSIDAAYQLIQKPKVAKPKKKETGASVTEARPEEQADADRDLNLPPPCDVIVINNAWGSSSTGISRLTELPILKMASTDCILWLWTPVKHIRNVFPVLDKWGFEFRTILAWLKPEAVKGEWLYEMADFCFVATRGEPAINTDCKLGTFLKAMAEKGAHEPQHFFTMVEERCAGPTRLEIFAESPREGWLAWPPLEKKGKTDKKKSRKTTPEKDLPVALAEKKPGDKKGRKSEPTQSNVEPQGETSTKHPETSESSETTDKSS